MENNIQTIQQDTIDLRELFAVLKRRKKLIGVTTGVLTLLAIVYAFLIAKPVYEVKSTIEIARIDKKPVQEINDFQKELETIFDVGNKRKKTEFPRVSKINNPKKTKYLLEIYTQGYDNQSAQDKAGEIIDYIKKQQNKDISEYIVGQKRKLTLIKNEIERADALKVEIEQDMINYKKKLQNISKEDAALAGIYSIEIGKKQSELNNLISRIYYVKNQKNDLERSISPLNIKMAKNLKTDIYNSPIKPKKKLIVVVAFITGLMLSIFLAFFLEFLQGIKREEEIR